MGYKENLATGISVFKDLTSNSVGAVHLASLPPAQASGMLVQPTSRGKSHPQPSASANFAPILEEGKKGEEEDQRKIGRRRSCKNPTSSRKLLLPPQAPGLIPSSRLPEHSSVHPSTLHSMYILVTIYMNKILLNYPELFYTQTRCILMHYFSL